MGDTKGEAAIESVEETKEETATESREALPLVEDMEVEVPPSVEEEAASESGEAPPPVEESIEEMLSPVEETKEEAANEEATPLIEEGYEEQHEDLEHMDIDESAVCDEVAENNVASEAVAESEHLVQKSSNIEERHAAPETAVVDESPSGDIGRIDEDSKQEQLACEDDAIAEDFEGEVETVEVDEQLLVAEVHLENATQDAENVGVEDPQY